MTIIDTAAEESIIDTIENAAMHSTLVIVDLEGTASMMAGFDATFTSIESEKRGFRPNQSIAQLKTLCLSSSLAQTTLRGPTYFVNSFTGVHSAYGVRR
jgi:hypothetical protein